MAFANLALAHLALEHLAIANLMLANLALAMSVLGHFVSEFWVWGTCNGRLGESWAPAQLGEPWFQARLGEPGGTAFWTLHIKNNSKNPYEQAQLGNIYALETTRLLSQARRAPKELHYGITLRDCIAEF